jgi:WXG100 family type VII secretion target
LTESPFTVTPEVVRQASQDCGSAAEGVEQQLEQLRSYVSSLGSYTGISADNWRLLMDSVHGDAMNLHTAIVGIADALKGVHDAYVEVEVVNNKQIEEIASQLPSLNL